MSETDGEAIKVASSYSLLWTLAACGFIEGGADFDPPPSAAKTTIKKWKNRLSGTPQGSFVPEDMLAAFYAWRYDASLWSRAMQQIASSPTRTLCRSFATILIRNSASSRRSLSLPPNAERCAFT